MRFTRRHLALWVSSSSSTYRCSAYTSSLERPRRLPSFLVKSSLQKSVCGAHMSTSATSSNEDNNTLRVALCQFAVTEDKEQNHRTAQSFITDAAVKHHAKLIVLPEIWNSPYATSAFGEYAEDLPDVTNDIGDTNEHDNDDSKSANNSSSSVQLMRKLARQHQVWLVGGSIPERVEHDNGNVNLYNTCLVMNPRGQIIAKHRKVHLFDIDVPNGITFRESDTLTAGNSLTHFSTPFGEIGIGICYDIRFAEYALLLAKKCRILIYPGAFNTTTGPAHWELLQRARAVDTQCFVLTASPARSNNDSDRDSKYPKYTAWGHSSVISPWGDIIATTDETAGIVVADLDLSRIDEIRQSVPIRNQKRNDLYEMKLVDENKL